MPATKPRKSKNRSRRPAAWDSYRAVLVELPPKVHARLGRVAEAGGMTAAAYARAVLVRHLEGEGGPRQ